MILRGHEKVKAPPLVSVIVPAYQSAPTLRRALDSALGQDYPALEVIVADDGSTDDTRLLVEHYQSLDPRVHYHWQTNQGVSSARNLAIARAGGEYLAFLDADDEWLPGKLRLQAEVLTQNEAVGLVFTDSLNTDVRSGRPRLFSQRHAWALRELRLTPIDNLAGAYLLNGNLRLTLYQAALIHLSTVMIRASTCLQLGGFAVNWIGPEDLDLWLRAARCVRFAYCARQLAVHHLQAGSLSRLCEHWLQHTIAYSQLCLRSPEYADLREPARRALRRRYRMLVFYYGRHRQPRQAWAAFRASREAGFDSLSALCALGSLLGPFPFKVAGRLLWP